MVAFSLWKCQKILRNFTENSVRFHSRFGLGRVSFDVSNSLTVNFDRPSIRRSLLLHNGHSPAKIFNLNFENSPSVWPKPESKHRKLGDLISKYRVRSVRFHLNLDQFSRQILTHVKFHGKLTIFENDLFVRRYQHFLVSATSVQIIKWFRKFDCGKQ